MLAKEEWIDPRRQSNVNWWGIVRAALCLGGAVAVLGLWVMVLNAWLSYLQQSIVAELMTRLPQL